MSPSTHDVYCSADGAVEPELLSHRRDCRRCRIATEDRSRRITGQDLRADEHDHGDRGEDRDARGKAPDDEPDERVGVLTLGAHRARRGRAL